MAGLITGVTVLPRAMAEADEAPRVERRVRLFANQPAAIFGDRPGFGFVLRQGAAEPARDSVRIPGSPLILTGSELTEIAGQNQLDGPLQRVGGTRAVVGCVRLRSRLARLGTVQ